MRPERRAFSALVVLAVMAGPAAGQVPFRFEFRPDPLLAVRTIVESRGDVVLVGVPGLSDSVVAESESLAGLTRRVQAGADDPYTLSLTFDSVRTRSRWRNSAWRDVRLAPAGPVTLEFVTDARLSVFGPRAVDDSAQALLVSGAAGLTHLALPGVPLVPGEEWDADFVFPFAMEIPGEEPGIIVAPLTGPGIGTLDSLVLRGSDTLAYLSVRGRFIPTSAQTTFALGGSPALAELWGGFAGQFIWSTGWGAFVSVALTTRVNQRLEAPLGSGVEDARITSTLTTRVWVRP